MILRRSEVDARIDSGDSLVVGESPVVLGGKECAPGETVDAYSVNIRALSIAVSQGAVVWKSDLGSPAPVEETPPDEE